MGMDRLKLLHLHNNYANLANFELKKILGKKSEFLAVLSGIMLWL